MKERVRAVIIKKGKTLLIKRQVGEITYWVFPGGGVEHGETHIDALKRECFEELGLEVNPGKLLVQQVSCKHSTKGQIEYFYTTELVGEELGTGMGPEYDKVSVYEGTHEPEWVEGVELASMDVRPVMVRDMARKNVSMNLDMKK